MNLRAQTNPITHENLQRCQNWGKKLHLIGVLELSVAKQLDRTIYKINYGCFALRSTYIDGIRYTCNLPICTSVSNPCPKRNRNSAVIIFPFQLLPFPGLVL